jgi:hypothetical protein
MPQSDALAAAQRRFVRELVGLELNQQRGALAALRRGLGQPPGVGEMHPFVVPRLPPDGTDSQINAFTPPRFAWHPRHWQRDESRRASNLGASFARLVATTRPRVPSAASSRCSMPTRKTWRVICDGGRPAEIEGDPDRLACAAG